METTATCRHLPRASTCPSWLQAAIADIEQRVRSLAVALPEPAESDSFAERAENYYQKRPQLHALIEDLHKNYLYLADRYSQSLAHHRKISSVHFEIHDSDDDSFDRRSASSFASDVGSSLSFQEHPHTTSFPPMSTVDVDLIAAELISTAVERDLLAAIAAEADQRRSDSTRKIELQASLLEVLESERLVLLAENARLGFRAASASEEAAAVAAELGYWRRKAGELVSVVGKLRGERGICLLGRRIECLRAQIYGLEKRNREWAETMARREKERGADRAEIDRLREENRRLRDQVKLAMAKKRDGTGRWWARVKQIEWVPCAPQADGGKGVTGCFCV